MEAINNFYLHNGKIKEVNEFKEEAKGQIIYEVLRVVKSNPAFLIDHIKRMKKSFEIINKEFPFDVDKVNNYVDEVVKANEYIEGNIKITYNTSTEDLNIYYIKHSYPSKDMYGEGVKTILYYGERENPNAKIINSSFRELVNAEIKKANAFEAILVDRNGNITEGSKSNIFAIKDGKLITAKAGDVLKGITREKIIMLAKGIGLDVEERDINAEYIKSLDAMFISGTSPKILPIACVNHIKLDVKNEVLRNLMKAYNELLCGKREIEKF